MESHEMFEIISEIIQESFKDHPETKIIRNFKIDNVSNRLREIDILLILTVNGYEINIAIECKDYQSRVPVKEIEAYHSKCLRIKNLNKKVFIAKNGFQKDAINAAEDFGIQLYTLNEVTKEELSKWTQYKSITAFKSHKQIKLLKICGKQKGTFEGDSKEMLLFTAKHRKGIELKQFLLEFNEEKIPGRVIMLTDDSFGDFNLEFQITFPIGLYVYRNLIYDLKHIHFEIQYRFEEVKSKTVFNTYKESNAEVNVLEMATNFSEIGETVSLVRKDRSNIIELIAIDKDNNKAIDRIDLMNESNNLNVRITDSAIIVTNNFVKKKLITHDDDRITPSS